MQITHKALGLISQHKAPNQLDPGSCIKSALSLSQHDRRNSNIILALQFHVCNEHDTSNNPHPRNVKLITHFTHSSARIPHKNSPIYPLLTYQLKSQDLISHILEKMYSHILFVLRYLICILVSVASYDRNFIFF